MSNTFIFTIRHNNFFGTYLLGPLLIRNPYFLEYIVKVLLDNKKLKWKRLNQDVSYAAYEEYLDNFVYNKK